MENHYCCSSKRFYWLSQQIAKPTLGDIAGGRIWGGP
jgi:hypothetical protein